MNDHVGAGRGQRQRGRTANSGCRTQDSGPGTPQLRNRSIAGHAGENLAPGAVPIAGSRVNSSCRTVTTTHAVFYGSGLSPPMGKAL